MVVRGASGRKIPHSRVNKDEELYFMQKGTKKVSAKARVVNVENHVKLLDSEIEEKLSNPKLNLTDKQKERWHKKCLVLIEFEDVLYSYPFLIIFLLRKKNVNFLTFPQVQDQGGK